jgi:hypothetical protein
VVRGDTPGSHSFVNGISAGSIPVIISDAFEYCSTPFNDVINLKEYTVKILEAEVLEDPLIIIKTLEELTEEQIKKKLKVLVEVQKMMLLDHPESKVCSLILQEKVNMFN